MTGEPRSSGPLGWMRSRLAGASVTSRDVITIAVLIFFFTVALGWSPGSGHMEPHRELPDLALVGLDGRDTNLDELRGDRASLVVFWGTWCESKKPDPYPRPNAGA